MGLRTTVTVIYHAQSISNSLTMSMDCGSNTFTHLVNFKFINYTTMVHSSSTLFYTPVSFSPTADHVSSTLTTSICGRVFWSYSHIITVNFDLQIRFLLNKIYHPIWLITAYQNKPNWNDAYMNQAYDCFL